MQGVFWNARRLVLCWEHQCRCSLWKVAQYLHRFVVQIWTCSQNCRSKPSRRSISQTDFSLQKPTSPGLQKLGLLESVLLPVPFQPFLILLQPKFRKKDRTKCLQWIAVPEGQEMLAVSWLRRSAWQPESRKQMVSRHWDNLKQVAKVSESVPMFLGPPSW